MLMQEREVARFSHYAILRYGYLPNFLHCRHARAFETGEAVDKIFCNPSEVAMKSALKPLARSSQNNYYRRLLSDRPHPLKNYDLLAKIDSLVVAKKFVARLSPSSVGISFFPERHADARPDPTVIARSWISCCQAISSGLHSANNPMRQLNPWRATRLWQVTRVPALRFWQILIPK